MPRSKSKPETQLAKEVKELSKEIRRLKSMDFMRVFSNPFKFLGLSFLKGLMVGFGSVLGASLLVGVFVYFLSKISLVPYVGDFVEEVVSQIQLEQTSLEIVE